MSRPKNIVARFLSSPAGCGTVVFLCIGILAYQYFVPPSLTGGTRLRYSIDFEQALQEGRITQPEFEARADLMRQTIEIVQKRVDPFGRRLLPGGAYAAVVEVDSSHFVIEFPRLPKAKVAERVAEVRSHAESVSELECYIQADVDAAAAEFDFVQERERVQSWIKRNPGASIRRFNALAPEEGGPPGRLHWFPRHIPSHAGPESHTPIEERLVPLIQQQGGARFTDGDLAHVGISSDAVGLPAVSLSVMEDRKAEFASLTREHVGDGLAIVFDDEIIVLAVINEELAGSFILNGGAQGFRMSEVNRLVRLLRSGPLPVRPEFEGQELIVE